MDLPYYAPFEDGKTEKLKGHVTCMKSEQESARARIQSEQAGSRLHSLDHCAFLKQPLGSSPKTNDWPFFRLSETKSL